MGSNFIFRYDWPIKPQNLCPWLVKSSQSNFNLRSPDFYWVRSYLITTVYCVLLRREHKQIEIPYLLTGLFPIPYNKLPWHPPRKPTRTTTVQSRNTSTTPRSSSVPALGPPNGFSDKTKVRKIALFYFALCSTLHNVSKKMWMLQV